MSKNTQNLTKVKRTHDYTAKQLAALTAPRTREVFDVLVRERHALSVAELQDALEFHSKAVYYQVRKLVGVGLVRAVSSEGAVSYAPIAINFQMPPGYQGVAYERLAAKAVGGVLRKQARQFSAAAEASKNHPELVDLLHVRTATIRMSKARMTRLKAEVLDLFKRYVKDADPEHPAVDLVLVTAPRKVRRPKK